MFFAATLSVPLMEYMPLWKALALHMGAALMGIGLLLAWTEIERRPVLKGDK